MSQPQWVKLFLVPQTDHLNSMPPSVVGLLTGETPSSYILNPMLEESEDDETFDDVYIPVGLNFINKTYVWRNQILDHKPEIGEIKQLQKTDIDADGYGMGGLG